MCDGSVEKHEPRPQRQQGMQAIDAYSELGFARPKRFFRFHPRIRKRASDSLARSGSSSAFGSAFYGRSGFAGITNVAGAESAIGRIAASIFGAAGASVGRSGAASVIDSCRGRLVSTERADA